MKDTMPRIMKHVDVESMKVLVITFNDGSEKRLYKGEYYYWSWLEGNNRLYVYDEKGKTVAIYKLEFVKCVEEKLEV